MMATCTSSAGPTTSSSARAIASAPYAPSRALADALQAHVKSQTAPYKYPRIVDFAEQLPKTESGKIRRAQLRAD